MKSWEMTCGQRTAIITCIIGDMIMQDNVKKGDKRYENLLSEYPITHLEMNDSCKVHFIDVAYTQKNLSLKERKISRPL